MGLLTRLRGPKAKREAPVEDAPLFLITGRPRSATEPRPFQRFPDEYRNTAPSQRADRPAPALTIPSSASAVSHNDVATPHDASSSTYSPSRLGDSSGWQGQPKRPSCELYDDGGLAEEIEDSPQRERFTPPLQDEWRVATDSMPVDPSSSPPPPSSFPARRLLRRASGKLKDLKMLRPVSRGATERSDFPNPGSSAGQSQGAYSTISLFSAHSTSDLALPSTSPGKESVALSVPRRARALSSSSAKDVIGLFPTTAPFSRALGRSVAADPSSDSPPTPLLDGQTTPALNDSPHAPSSRWKKTPGRSERPSTALGVPSMSCATYLSHISPPPKGLPAHDLAGRKGLVCHIVQTRTLEESRTKSKRKGALQVTLKGLPPSSTPPSHTTETVMSRFEDEVHQFMQEDILRGTDAQVGTVGCLGKRCASLTYHDSAIRTSISPTSSSRLVGRWEWTRAACDCTRCLTLWKLSSSSSSIAVGCLEPRVLSRHRPLPGPPFDYQRLRPLSRQRQERSGGQRLRQSTG